MALEISSFGKIWRSFSMPELKGSIVTRTYGVLSPFHLRSSSNNPWESLLTSFITWAHFRATILAPPFGRISNGSWSHGNSFLACQALKLVCLQLICMTTPSLENRQRTSHFFIWLEKAFDSSWWSWAHIFTKPDPFWFRSHFLPKHTQSE